MKNDKQKLVSKKIVIAYVVLSYTIGFVCGMVVMAASQAARLADDIHDVKQDFDKSKHRVAEDYRHAADKAREVLDNTDTKQLGKDATKSVRELGGLLKNKLKKRLDND